MGTYARVQRIAAAQSKLYDEILHDDQVIWCSDERPALIPLEEPRYLHTIQPDPDDLVAVLNGFVWEHLIGNTRCIPPDLRSEMRFWCVGAEATSRQKLLGQLEARYLAEHLPRDLWANVVSTDGNCPMPVFLLRWPFGRSLIMDVQEYRGEASSHRA